MIDRMSRAVQMKVDLYEEVERDPSLDGEAFQVVLLVGAAAGIGAFLGGLLGGSFVGGLVLGVIDVVLTVLLWYLWSGLVLLVGTRLFGGTADFGEVRRTIAYAYSPNVIQVLSFIPGLGGLLTFLGSIWALVLGVVAIRQAMDFGTGTAIATVVIAGIIAFLIVFVVSLILSAIVLIPLGIAMMR